MLHRVRNSGMTALHEPAAASGISGSTAAAPSPTSSRATPAARSARAKLLSENPDAYRDAAIAGIRTLLGVAPARRSRPTRSPRSRWARPSPPMRCSSARATAPCSSSRGASATRSRSATRRGRTSSPRQIVKPEMLYERVVEVDERVRADGTVEARARSRRGPARSRSGLDDGIRSVAIVFMHAWTYPEHERAVAALARDIGFPQVSVSHEVSPLIKLVGRGDTTVVDAYLSPILRRYVDGRWRRPSSGRRRAAKRRRLMFMLSSGGLTAAGALPGQGRDPLRPGRRRRRRGRDRAGSPASARSSASTWAAPRPTSPTTTANTSAPSRPRSPACACARR